MGDFLIDFRACSQRQMDQAAEFLRFFDDMRVERVDRNEFALVLTSPDRPDLWASCQSADGNLFVAFSGRIALEEKEWSEAEQVKARGGLAARAILKRYQCGGPSHVADLSGHFVILIFDQREKRFFIITDRWGVAPAFRYDAAGHLMFSSHPDALADAAGETQNWDLTSLAEFILTSKLSFPFTYYRQIQSLPVASITTVLLDGALPRIESTRPYFDFQFDPQPVERFETLAEELAQGLRTAMARRTTPRLGRTALALSGGLDSRTLLCAAPKPENLVTFCCHDEENDEFLTARALARTAGTEFLPMRRSPDFYADHAALGVKISAGMGCIASNHFLGFRDQLKNIGADNLITGCYCDYIFKGLAFNKRLNRWTTVESVGGFDFSYYAAHRRSETPLGRAVRQRLEDQFPEDGRRFDSESAIADVEHRRLFPLSYEEDNAARSIPQRVMGWYVPVAENDLMTTRLKMSSAMKLNRRLFASAVERVCGPAVSRIPDANTGTRVNAPLALEAVCHHARRAGRLLRKLRPAAATNGSWLNWSYYVAHSAKLQALWNTPNPVADDIFEQVLGRENYQKDIRSWSGHQLWLFLQLFTVKLWLDQRTSRLHF
jgi:asparagine synthase (glutamine-hydrolysing)